MSDLTDFVADKLAESYSTASQFRMLADMAGVSATTIRHLHDGQGSGNAETIEKIIDALGYDIVLRKRKTA